ncbi:MAG: MFS transporter, partial [Microbacteriaceae bacterium]|nr:MFS transporter [Microbacteriaceae bacterium]
MSPSLRPSRGTVVLLAAIVATVAFSVLQSFMAPLLPSLQETFDISTTTVTWLMTGYLLSACITAPIVGRLGDIYGHVLVLRIAMLVMTGGMVLQALSWSFETLLAARFIQGCGGAIIPLC